MPTWGELLNELRVSALPNGAPDFDGVRRKYVAQLHALTGRDLIIYYTDWLAGGGPGTAITLEDMQAMMEVCKDLRGPELDLVLHTPGGSAEATASVVDYLRQKFTHIRVFVPLAAMSAGTMWALSANELVMGKHSQLGPIDPQLWAVNRYVPARAIVEQFQRAKEEIAANPAALQAWFPILQQYGPSLLSECDDAEALSRRLVAEWLEKYMFAGTKNAKRTAQSVAKYFADYSIHKSHSLGITRTIAKQKGLSVVDLESDQALQDAVLTVHHASMHTLAGPAVKLVENHLGRTFAKLSQQIAVPSVRMGPTADAGPSLGGVF